MPHEPLGAVLEFLHKISATKELHDLADADLLQRFVASREEAAFTVLVHRHGPMVLAVCRRLLGDVHRAEDAFQATFMVLVRKAGSVRRQAPLANWLYGVAQRVALKARTKAAVQQSRQRELTDMPSEEPLDDLTWQELRPILDEEIAKLPQKYRAPIVLCYLEGKTQEQAAQELGCPRGSLASRLDVARKRLRDKLTRRGLALSVGALTTALAERSAGASVGAMLTINTAKAAASLTAGTAAAATILSAQVIALMEEAMKGMIVAKLKLVLAVLVVGLTISGIGVAGYSGWITSSERREERSVNSDGRADQSQPAKGKNEEPRRDINGDPLPAGAIARLGTTRFRHVGATTVAYALNGKVLVSGSRDAVQITDAATGQVLRRFSHSRPNDDMLLAVSADGKLLVSRLELEAFSVIDIASGKELRRLDLPAPPTKNVDPGQIALSPNGEYLAFRQTPRPNGPQNNVIYLWETRTGNRLSDAPTFIGATMGPFSQDGKLLCGVGGDSWDVATGTKLKLYSKPKGDYPKIVAFSPAGGIAALAREKGVNGNKGGGVLLLSLATGEITHCLGGEDREMQCMAFSADGHQLASAEGATIFLWDPNTGRELRSWQAHHSTKSLSFSPDGKVLVSVGTPDSCIRRWDTATGQEIEQTDTQNAPIQMVRFAAEGKSLLSCGQDRKILEWDIQTGRAKAKDHIRIWSAIAGAGMPWVHADLSPNGKTLALVTATKGPKKSILQELSFWDTASGDKLRELAGHGVGVGVRAVKFSPDGKILASAGADGIRLWDVATGKQLLFVDDPEFKSSFPKGGSNPFSRFLAFSPDGKLLAATRAATPPLTQLNVKNGVKTTAIRVVGMWEIATGKQLRRWELPPLAPQQIGQQPKGVPLAITIGIALAFSPDGKTLAGSDNDGIYLWDAATGTELRHLEGGVGRLDYITFSPNGKLLAAVDPQSGVVLWETATGKETHRFRADIQNGIVPVDFSPDGRVLATGGADSTILLWDLNDRAK